MWPTNRDRGIKWYLQRIIFITIGVAIFCSIVIYFRIKEKQDNDYNWNLTGTILSWNITTGVSTTWSIVQTGLVITEDWPNNTQLIEKVIVSDFVINKKYPSISDYPVIRLNEYVEDLKLVVEIDFTDWFEQKYSYENSEWYFFALNIFLWDLDNGWFYEVYRKANGWVWNSIKHWLNWAKPAYKIKDWTEREIPITNSMRIAVGAEERTKEVQFKYFGWLNYLYNHIGENIPLWVYLSSTKEVKWRNLTYIKSMKLVYKWKETDVEIMGK